MLSIKNVSYSYDSGSAALKDVSLDIEEGSFVAIVGHNGSGKSTLAKMLNGLLLPTEGSVTVNGMDTADEDKTLDIRRKVGMVFQNPDNQIVTTVVREDVAFGPENLGIPTEEMIVRVDEALKAVGMEKYAESAPHMLSGGQKQRIAIARAILRHSAIIILDEATASVDVETEQQIQKAVMGIAGRSTIIAIAHRLSTIRNADQILVIENGRITERGTHAQLMAQDGLYKELYELQFRGQEV